MNLVVSIQLNQIKLNQIKNYFVARNSFYKV